MRSNASLAAGAIRFDVMVTLGLIFVLMSVLLVKLVDVQREAEHTVVDMQVAVLRTELQGSIASRIARGEDAKLAGWVGRNPEHLAWGETSAAPVVEGFSLSGQWRWNAGAGALVYTYRGGGCLQLRLARGGQGLAGWSLGGGLFLVPLRKENEC